MSELTMEAQASEELATILGCEEELAEDDEDEAAPGAADTEPLPPPDATGRLFMTARCKRDRMDQASIMRPQHN